jgi:hypothetical protein
VAVLVALGAGGAGGGGGGAGIEEATGAACPFCIRIGRRQPDDWGA